MKFVATTLFALASAGTVMAGSAVIEPITPEASSGGGNEGALLILLVIGGIWAINQARGNTTSRAAAPAPQDANDDDIIMKF